MDQGGNSRAREAQRRTKPFYVRENDVKCAWLGWLQVGAVGVCRAALPWCCTDPPNKPCSPSSVLYSFETLRPALWIRCTSWNTFGKEGGVPHAGRVDLRVEDTDMVNFPGLSRNFQFSSE